MRVRWTGPVLLNLAALIVVVGTAFATSRLFDGMVRSVEDSRFELMRAIALGTLADTLQRTAAGKLVPAVADPSGALGACLAKVVGTIPPAAGAFRAAIGLDVRPE